MKKLLRMMIVLSLMVASLATNLSAAAFDDTEQQNGLRQGSTFVVPTMTKDEALIKKLEDAASLPELDNGVKKPTVVLKGEPGDGLVKLNWVLLSRVPDQNLRYSVRYGTESEKYIRTVAVGSGNEYVLRELRNFQPCFIQLLALDRDQKTLFKSEEIQVTPLPMDAQSSIIEKAFLKTNPTMQEVIEPERMKRDLKQFGYDFFRNSLQLTSAIDAMPVGANYILGPGDVVSLNVWGSLNLRQELAVDRNGEIMVPKVGTVRVWGLTFDAAKLAVKTAMSRYFRDFEMSLTMGKLRTVQVYVVGEVVAPGNYPVSSMATVINALAAAGGPSSGGSLRNVRVTRGTQTVATVDLYEMLLSGDRNKDVQLQNGDTIFVPVIGPVVAVAGEVRRPAIYELNGRSTISEVLKMAGGVAASGSLGRVQIERLENNNSRIVLDYLPKKDAPEANFSNIELKDRDMLKVFPVNATLRQVVILKGNVQQAGEYQFRAGMRLTDLIPSTQVLLPESHLDSVEVTRLLPPDFRKELITVSLRKAFTGSQADNMLLQEQDAVKVFSRLEMEEKRRVSINGAVINQGAYDYFTGMTIRDLVVVAGSIKRNAHLGQAELSRITISNDKAQVSRIMLNLGKALAGDPEHNIVLQSDDVLIVREVADWQDSADKMVTLRGEVRFPGIYSLSRGETLSSVIARAGGYTDKAYLRGAKFTRRSVREMQQKRMDEISSKTEQDITKKQSEMSAVAASKEELDATKAALDGLQKSVIRLKSLKAEGRMVLLLGNNESWKGSSNDLVLEGGDELDIPLRPSVVSVLGQVYNPNSFVYDEGKSAAWYLGKTGGPVSDAETSEIYLVRADGTVSSRQQTFFGSFLSTEMEAGDTLVVPQRLERTAWLREIKDWTQILANIALTAGTIMLGLR